MKLSSGHAFSLVEVALALGVASFALVAIFGLLPVGTASNQATTEQTTAANLATSVAADLRATLAVTTSVPKPISPQFLFDPTNTSANGQAVFIADDNSITATGTNAHFRVTVWCTPPKTGYRSATQVRVLITWPAAADPIATTVPTRYSGSFETVIALNRN